MKPNRFIQFLNGNSSWESKCRASYKESAKVYRTIKHEGKNLEHNLVICKGTVFGMKNRKKKCCFKVDML